MQRQRSIFDTFPETVDLNQGPNHGMNESDEHNIRLSPTERRLLSNDLSGELNFNCENTNDHHNSRSFSSWDVGESSSRPNEQDSRFKERQLDPTNTQFHSTPNHIPMDVNLNLEYGGNSNSSGNDGGQGFRFMNLYKSGTPEMESDEHEHEHEHEHEPDCSFGNWGLSCKRKALEGTSSSSASQPSPVVNSPSAFTPPIATESSRRYNGIRDSGSGPFNISSTGTPGNSLPFRRLPHSEYLGQPSRGPILTPPNSSQPLNVQPPLVQVPGMPRNLIPFSRNGNSSRNNEQNSYFGPSNETRNMVQDPTNWSLATGRSSNNGGNNYRNDPVWIPHHVSSSGTHGQQRLTELPPWTLFPSSEVESVGHRGHFPILPSGSSSSSEENVLPSRGRHRQHFLRSGPLMEVPGDEWQAFASDIEGRHRLVSEMRQILNALRRGESLRAEDYMLFDPFINGVSELHDRHRDMRLDVDNMSYEELLALEERIGDVKTGLSEEVIMKSMKQRKHISFMAISTQNLEPCCICREEYINGDNIGSLECGHDFHTSCIKQWLSQKNLCPICKMTGLST
ncbi:E3 ubiquitin-protein ligase MBR2 [Lactuca sativa]|uniref:RING-type E3 ubiquitin transferase n=1 Tax=Lactuca sativa TaxID=4236 RepID=A0A9R1VGP6_LACSA|nr:E3 ubiquitin-protein ligase MBR2 [Lactuca sativa]KAJ0204413.1 hypothetical protein LSAT_V11C500270560 [Lactuca sativa]